MSFIKLEKGIQDNEDHVTQQMLRRRLYVAFNLSFQNSDTIAQCQT